MNNDLVKGQLSSEQVDAVLGLVTQIGAQLPLLVDLTADDRRTLPKLGDKSRAFVDQALLVATQNPGIMPRSFDIDAYRVDVEVVRRLEPLVMAVGQLHGRLEDTLLAAGSDAYSQSLLVYHAAKQAGKDGSLEQHLEGLSRRFARKTPAANAKAAVSPAPGFNSRLTPVCFGHCLGRGNARCFPAVDLSPILLRLPGIGQSPRPALNAAAFDRQPTQFNAHHSAHDCHRFGLK